MKKDLTILVLEDNKDDFFLLKETVDSSDEFKPDFYHCERLEDAIIKAGEHNVDVAILDLQVPDSHGLETFQAFYNLFPHIPAIVLTGFRDSDLAIKAVQMGAQDYLNKDEINSSNIVRVIRYAVERHGFTAKLEKTKNDLEQSLKIASEKEREIGGLLKGARAVLEQNNFDIVARNIFDICSEIIGSTSGYVAMLSEDGAENELLFLEAGGLPCTVDPELPMPIRGLRQEAYRTNKAVYNNDFMKSEWEKFMPSGHVILKNVMFAPLVLEEKTVGVIGLANKKDDFSDEDARLATAFGELAAIALKNSKNLEERNKAENEREKFIDDLKRALDEVKTLRGILPICSYCKKIRDDEGYWQRVESYIGKRSGAEFSHGICPDCAKKHFGDLDLEYD